MRAGMRTDRERAGDATPMDTQEPSSAEPPSSPASSESDDAPGREPTGQHGLGGGIRHRGPRFELVDPDGLLGGGLGARTDAAVRVVLEQIPVAGEVRARVVDDDAMSAAHVEYLDVEGTTDVLTFDMSETAPDGSRVLDADLLICVDEARRQAEQLGHAVEHELALYIVHGVLHCTGYDDLTEDGARAMHAEEDRLLLAAGIGAVFTGRPIEPGPGGGEA